MANVISDSPMPFLELISSLFNNNNNDFIKIERNTKYPNILLNDVIIYNSQPMWKTKFESNFQLTNEFYHFERYVIKLAKMRAKMLFSQNKMHHILIELNILNKKFLVHARIMGRKKEKPNCADYWWSLQSNKKSDFKLNFRNKSLIVNAHQVHIDTCK